MQDYRDLEIQLTKPDANTFRVQFCHQDPDSGELGQCSEGVVGFSPSEWQHECRRRLDKPEELGKYLRDGLFADLNLGDELAKASEKKLRLRLNILPTAAELQWLPWETLRGPEDKDGNNSWLVANERILFSRVPPLHQSGPTLARPKRDLKALIVIANPTDLEAWKLKSLNVEQEKEWLGDGLGTMTHQYLISHSDKPGQASLDRVIDHLREEYDVFCLVCHGAWRMDKRLQFYLILEDNNGKTAWVSDANFIEQLDQLPVEAKPRLIVLASCQSALDQPRDGAGLSSLGRRLAEKVAPAVLAMQANISSGTARPFMREFFTRLRDHGEIDQATAAARGKVRNRPDAWVPVLYMSLKSGLLWYKPGSDPRQKGYESWSGLISSIRAGKCMPVLGAGLKGILSPRDLANTWADEHSFPFPPDSPYRDELSFVSQYLAITQQPEFPYTKFVDYLTNELQTASRDQMADGEQKLYEPYGLLAKLPFTIYINTNPDDRLADALVRQKKTPQLGICRWNNDMLENLPNKFNIPDGYKPDVDNPLIYHLFGHFSVPKSLLLTEDDYFDYLMWVNRHSGIAPPSRRSERESDSNEPLETAIEIPLVVEKALFTYTLLFLGFKIEDWNFRLLFRSIFTRDRRRDRHGSVAVQYDLKPNSRTPDAVKDYFARYFNMAWVALHWRKPEKFIEELWEHWVQEQKERGELYDE